MTSRTSSTQSPAINFTVMTPANETGFDFPLSPSEPGKFDFYRVHLTNQAHRKDSIFAEQQEIANQPVETSNPTRRWTPFANIRDPSMVSIKKSAATDADLPSSNSSISNKPIQTVASFSSLTDAVKNAMKKGSITAGPSPLSRPDKRSSVSSKDLNHLSPQSM